MTTTTGTSRRHLGLTLGLLAFAQLIIAVDYTIVFVGLPAIGDGLQFSEQTLQWVVSAYAVAFGGFLLLGGRAADLFGRRRMFIAGLFLYAVSSLAGGLAEGPELLIAARAVQGLGGALLSPTLLALISSLFPEGRERNRALAVWGGAGSSGMVLGSLLGGVLTETVGWRGVFFVNVPLAVAGLVAAFWLLPADGRRETGRSFDVAGALTATAGATLLVFALVQGPTSGWTSTVVLGSLIGAVLLLGAFLFIESRSLDPLMPLRLLANRSLSTGVVVTASFMATFGALAYFFTMYFSEVLGYNPLSSGFGFVLPCVGVLVGTQIGGRMSTRFGVRNALIAGLALGVVGTVAFAAAVTPGGSYLSIAPGLAVLSIGQGILFTAMFAAALSGVSPEHQGVGSGIVVTGQQVGGALGLAVLVAVANASSGALDGTADVAGIADGIRTAAYVAAAGIAGTILIALAFPRHRPEPLLVSPPVSEPAA
ncbi:MAG TPA: MFS transporter [Actinoplanes sp.]|nr:MFS transporter [Actinoplanes sp.]